MEIVIALLVLVVGVGLLLGPRIARRRRAPALAARSGRWNGAAARGVRTPASRRSAAVASAAPAAAAYVQPADEDAWDDDLDWVDEPPAADAPAAPAPPAASVTPAPSAAASAPQAPSGRTWGAGTATLADTHAGTAPATALHTPPAAPATALQKVPATAATTLQSPSAAPAPALGAMPARPLDAEAATPAAPLGAADPLGAAPAAPRVPRRSLKATTAPSDDIDAEWSNGVDVPPPRITRGAAAFGAASHPTVTTTKRGSFASRHPIVLVAAYAAAGIALVVIGVSVISSGSFRSSGAPAGERTTAEVKVKPSPVPTAVHTATPKPTATPEATPDPATLQAKRERAAWLRERRSARGSEARAVADARAKARADARRRAAKKRRQSSGSGAPPAATPAPAVKNPAPAPAPRPQPKPQPAPCEFCIG